MSKSRKDSNAMMRMAITQSIKGKEFIDGKGPDGECSSLN